MKRKGALDKVKDEMKRHTEEGMKQYKKVLREIAQRETDKAEKERAKSANMKQSVVSNAHNRAMRRLLATGDEKFT